MQPRTPHAHADHISSVSSTARSQSCRCMLPSSHLRCPGGLLKALALCFQVLPSSLRGTSAERLPTAGLGLLMRLPSPGLKAAEGAAMTEAAGMDEPCP